MTLSFKHNFHSGKSDGSDPTLVQATAWNEEHVITLAAGKIIGRASDIADGAAQELPIAVDSGGNVTLPANLHIVGNLVIDGITTGIRFTGERTNFTGTLAQIPVGWLPMRGLSIGNALSGATERANADQENLFTLWWDNANVTLQDSSGTAVAKGASAAADWAANRRMVMPNYHQRFIRYMMDGTAAFTTNGADTHTHTASGVASGNTDAASSNINVDNSGGLPVATWFHFHSANLGVSANTTTAFNVPVNWSEIAIVKY